MIILVTFLAFTLYSSVSANCPPLPSPPNGNVVVGGFVTGALATYSCNPNFYVNGAITLTCSNMNAWTPEVPECKQVLCGALKAPANGSVSTNALTSESTTVGTVATFGCNPGFFLQGPSQITCTNAGHYGLWNGFYPSCLSRAPTADGYTMSPGSCIGHENILATSVLDPMECATRCTNDPTCQASNIYTAGAGFLTCAPMSVGCAPGGLTLAADPTRFFYQKVQGVTPGGGGGGGAVPPAGNGTAPTGGGTAPAGGGAAPTGNGTAPSGGGAASAGGGTPQPTDGGNSGGAPSAGNGTAPAASASTGAGAGGGAPSASAGAGSVSGTSGGKADTALAGR